jgi:RNA-directed DNA polymerase
MIDFRFKPESGHDDHQKPLITAFSFLGFTPVWVTSEKGRAMVRQLAAKDRRADAQNNLPCLPQYADPAASRSAPARLSRMFKGHYAYFGISGNYERPAALPYQVARIWRK